MLQPDQQPDHGTGHRVEHHRRGWASGAGAAVCDRGRAADNHLRLTQFGQRHRDRRFRQSEDACDLRCAERAALAEHADNPAGGQFPDADSVSSDFSSDLCIQRYQYQLTAVTISSCIEQIRLFSSGYQPRPQKTQCSGPNGRRSAATTCTGGNHLICGEGRSGLLASRCSSTTKRKPARSPAAEIGRSIRRQLNRKESAAHPRRTWEEEIC